MELHWASIVLFVVISKYVNSENEGMRPAKVTTGYFKILYAKRPCFVVQSPADPSSCLTWVRKRAVQSVRQHCAAIFYKTCVNSTSVVQTYNPSFCRDS
uniref:Lipocalin n=1 Tax=Rhipicephalus zambeziensis TaxID=60191 RepID=A0A224YCM3_9ACAR